jgi:acetylornithine deacetylase/succinyl-diaminopimelate desuccinylase-like protein
MGCAVQPALVHGPVAPATVAWRDRVDWPAAGEEAVALLQAFLRVDTTNPPGLETRGAEFLRERLANDGIESEIIEFAPGRGSLIARVKGDGSAPPLCLVSHLDVVGADAKRWPEGTGPLSGALAGGFVWGRGALDMKGMGALETMTVALLKRLRVPLRRDVVLLAVADEEVGNLGMEHVATHVWDKVGCSHAVNEGGIGMRDLLVKGQTVFAISVAEKGLLWARLVAQGPSGHGSTPVPGRAPEKLLIALDKLAKRDTGPRLHPSLRTLLAGVGAQAGGFTGFVLQRPTLVDWFVTGKLLDTPATRAGITDTIQVTGLHGAGESPNVVPSETGATLDCRLLPGTTPAAMQAEVLRLTDAARNGLSLQVIHAAEANESPVADPLFHALAKAAVEGRSDAIAGPVLSPGYTDSLRLRAQRSVRAYGFVPFEIDQALAATMHGENERVPVQEVHRGLRRLFTAVVEFAGAPGP